MKITNKFGFTMGVLGIVFAVLGLLAVLLFEPDLLLAVIGLNTIILSSLAIYQSTSKPRTEAQPARS